MQHIDTSHLRADANSSRAPALLDPDVGAVIAARDQRRHQGLAVLADRLGAEPDHVVRMLSFETLDTLAGLDRAIAAAIPDVLRLAEAAMRLS